MPDKPPIKIEQGHLTEPKRVKLNVLTEKEIEEEIRAMIAEAEGQGHLTEPEPGIPTLTDEDIKKLVDDSKGIDFSSGEKIKTEESVVSERREEVSKDFKVLTKERFMLPLVQIIWTLTTQGITNSPDDKFDLDFINSTAEESKKQLVEIAGFHLHDVQLKYIANELYKILETRKNFLTPFTSPIKTFFEKVFHYVPKGFSAWKENDSSQ